MDPTTIATIGAVAPTILSGVGDVIGGVTEFFGREPREVRIAEKLGQKQLELEQKQQQQQLEQYRKQFEAEPIYKEGWFGRKEKVGEKKPIAELQAEQEAKAYERKLEAETKAYEKKAELESKALERMAQAEATGFQTKSKAVLDQFENLRGKYGDITARSLLGALSFKPIGGEKQVAEMPMPQYGAQAPQLPFQPQFKPFQLPPTPIEYRGMARGVEGVSSTLLSFLKEGQERKEREKALKKFETEAKEETEKLKTLRGKLSKAQKERIQAEEEKEKEKTVRQRVEEEAKKIQELYGAEKGKSAESKALEELQKKAEIDPLAYLQLQMTVKEPKFKEQYEALEKLMTLKNIKTPEGSASRVADIITKPTGQMYGILNKAYTRWIDEEGIKEKSKVIKKLNDVIKNDPMSYMSFVLNIGEYAEKKLFEGYQGPKTYGKGASILGKKAKKLFTEEVPKYGKLIAEGEKAEKSYQEKLKERLKQFEETFEEQKPPLELVTSPSGLTIFSSSKK